jgi:hypothetical protein
MNEFGEKGARLTEKLFYGVLRGKMQNFQGKYGVSRNLFQTVAIPEREARLRRAEKSTYNKQPITQRL